MIPKIIHHTWKTTEIPQKWQHTVTSCKNTYHKYQYILWTDQQMYTFVRTQFPHIYSAWIHYPYHIQRCDAFRYMVLYTYGGIYMDLDVGCKAFPVLDSLVSGNNLIIAESSNSSVVMNTCYTNSFLASSQYNTFMKKCIEHLPLCKHHGRFFGKHMNIMLSTGPLFLTNMYKKHSPDNLFILKKADYSGNCTVCNSSSCTGGKFFFETTGNSWHSFDSTALNWLYCNIIKLYSVAIVLILMILIIFNKNKLKRFHFSY